MLASDKLGRGKRETENSNIGKPEMVKKDEKERKCKERPSFDKADHPSFRLADSLDNKINGERE
jgi:hypothetical protein